jgi:hypothetical protein
MDAGHSVAVVLGLDGLDHLVRLRLDAGLEAVDDVAVAGNQEPREVPRCC